MWSSPANARLRASGEANGGKDTDGHQLAKVSGSHDVGSNLHGEIKKRELDHVSIARFNRLHDSNTLPTYSSAKSVTRTSRPAAERRDGGPLRVFQFNMMRRQIRRHKRRQRRRQIHINYTGKRRTTYTQFRMATKTVFTAVENLLPASKLRRLNNSLLTSTSDVEASMATTTYNLYKPLGGPSGDVMSAYMPPLVPGRRWVKSVACAINLELQ